MIFKSVSTITPEATRRAGQPFPGSCTGPRRHAIDGRRFAAPGSSSAESVGKAPQLVLVEPSGGAQARAHVNAPGSDLGHGLGDAPDAADLEANAVADRSARFG